MKGHFMLFFKAPHTKQKVAVPAKAGTFIDPNSPRKVPDRCQERQHAISVVLYTLALLILASQPAKAKNYTYSPEHCAFTITFPEKPVIEESCDASPLAKQSQKADNGKNCHEVVSFNKVFSADSSLHIRASCSSGNKEQFDRYSGADMKGALEKLLVTDDVSEHKTTFDTLSNASVKRAGFLGYGKRKETPATIIGQLWLSPDSLFTLQVEMTGARDKKADAMLASILRSLKLADTDTAQEDNSAPASGEKQNNTNQNND